MSEPLNFWEAVQRIRREDSRYDLHAYGFVMDALEHTVCSLETRRHVTARELLQGMCSFARENYGVMSYAMLEQWGIRETSDIGNIVFHLIDQGALSKLDGDRREDFDDVLDLQAELQDRYFDM